jgi:hypothetical protein
MEHEFREVQPAEFPTDAACKGADTEQFFPLKPNGKQGEGLTRLSPAARSVVRLYCRDCIVRRECLEDAIAHDDFGVRGGLNTSQRQHLKAKYGGEAAAIALRGKIA